MAAKLGVREVDPHKHEEQEAKANSAPEKYLEVDFSSGKDNRVVHVPIRNTRYDNKEN